MLYRAAVLIIALALFAHSAGFLANSGLQVGLADGGPYVRISTPVRG